MLSRDEVTSYMKGVHFPAGKPHLQRIARQHKAPGEYFDMLHDLPDEKTFRSESEILDALGVRGQEGSRGQAA